MSKVYIVYIVDMGEKGTFRGVSVQTSRFWFELEPMAVRTVARVAF